MKNNLINIPNIKNPGTISHFEWKLSENLPIGSWKNNNTIEESITTNPASQNSNPATSLKYIKMKVYQIIVIEDWMSLMKASKAKPLVISMF
jgi:hypothetical protein